MGNLPQSADYLSWTTTTTMMKKSARLYHPPELHVRTCPRPRENRWFPLFLIFSNMAPQSSRLLVTSVRRKRVFILIIFETILITSFTTQRFALFFKFFFNFTTICLKKYYSICSISTLFSNNCFQKHSYRFIKLQINTCTWFLTTKQCSTS